MTAPVLGIDTSGLHCSVALVRGGDLVAERHEEMTRGQAEALMPMIAETLEAAAVGRRELAAIGVCTGPGNFTGLRIAVAAARGLALGLGRPAYGVTAFEALYGDRSGPALVVIPAPQDAVYAQWIDRSDGDALPRALSPPELVPPGADLPKVADVAGAPLVASAAATLPERDWAPSVGRVDGAALAATTARLAAVLAAQNAARPRPAPLYIRAADAAPSRHVAPKILP